jgi:putative transcriptional regulator
VKLENNLRTHRFEHDQISQQDLANAVGVTRLTIHSIETGKFNPSTLLALKIAQFFGVTVEDLFYIEIEDEEQQ